MSFYLTFKSKHVFSYYTLRFFLGNKFFEAALVQSLDIRSQQCISSHFLAKKTFEQVSAFGKGITVLFLPGPTEKGGRLFHYQASIGVRPPSTKRLHTL